MTIRLTLIATVAAAILATSALRADDPAREQKLQQAIDLIESKGDLAHAIPLLEDVSKSTDRALAARALLYLGQALERTDKARAKQTYERIIADFKVYYPHLMSGRGCEGDFASEVTAGDEAS